MRGVKTLVRRIIFFAISTAALTLYMTEKISGF